MKYILIINGFKTSGKDLFIDFLTEISDILVFRYSSIDYIKLVAERDFGWNAQKCAKGRKLLASLKDVSTEYNNLPFKKIIEKEETISLVKDSFIYCVCCREPKEIKKLLDNYTKEGYNAFSVCIQRKDVEGLKQSNSADSGIDDYCYDYYLQNNKSKEEFKEIVNKFYKENMID